jgi:hypothetical protein
MRGIVIAFLLLFSLSAQGQFIIDSYRFGAAAGLLLDSFPGAAAAYSLRLLDKDYAGNCIVVQRDNGDTTAIGFVGNYLDTASMKTFCGTGAGDSCRVQMWYEQSGNGNNVRQDSAIRQPLIMINGVINRVGGNVVLKFANSSNAYLFKASGVDLSATNVLTMFSSYSILDISTFPQNLITHGAGEGGSGPTTIAILPIGFNDSTTQVQYAQSATIRNIVTFAKPDKFANNTQYLLSVIGYSNTTQHSMNINSTPLAVTTTVLNAPDQNFSNSSFYISASSALRRYFIGDLHELILYPSDQSTNRTAIETNINNFYSIY